MAVRHDRSLQKGEYIPAISDMGYVSVIIDQNSRYTDSMFTYRAPDCVAPGAVVRVPFNKGNREKRGFVVGTCTKPDIDEVKIKDIISVEDSVSISPEAVGTCMWMRQRYGIKYIDAIRCFIPPGKPPKAGKEKRPLKDVPAEAQPVEKLTSAQKSASDMIGEAIGKRALKCFLIHGVTGSGKTEVYMQAAQRTIDEGRSVIMLVPEIALTKQITERFIGRFGKENVAILHSRLTGRERFDEWVRIREGGARIVIGARMGVFAPLDDIGLIIMDEEHEPTYKSDQTPKYETVDIAYKRLMYYGGVLLLGSATPSVVSYSRAESGVYKLIELPERYNGVRLPVIETADMKEELRRGNRGMFSDLFAERLDECLSAGRQAILFLNRRGYSTFVACRDCGHVIKCPDCGITLTYHKRENAGVCHYCGRKFKIPVKCPDCGSKYITYSGTGTEQVEEYVRSMYPDRRTDRLDMDTAKSRREITRILNSFSKGATDILVGTQLVAKGLDFRNVGMVGVVSADTTLNIPDYRSAERTFQLITQVAGRAGRGDERGRVVVQTFDPENPAIAAAVDYDYKQFYDNEIAYRKMMGYPPFTDLILAEFTSCDEKLALGAAERCGDYIKRLAIETTGGTIYDPRISERFIGQASGAFRYHILIKSGKGYRNKYLHYISKFGENMIRNGRDLSYTVDVNPYGSF